ncbi:MAG: Gfo/Idh/MocA family protein [Erysipelotrichaceae bacterium]
MKKMRLGIIGLGQQGGSYLNFIAEAKVKNVVVGAVCDIDPAKKADIAQRFPTLPFFENYIEMMESGLVDAVVTCVPHYLHPEMGIEALKRDIHALLEKPAGVYTKQVRELNEFSLTKPHLKFGVFFNQRTNPLYKKIKKIVEAGEIGNIRRTDWTITTWWRPQSYYDQSAWRATWGGEGGGVLVNQAPHQLDLFQWICGMPASISSDVKYGYQRDIAVEDDVTAVLDYGNGATGTFVTCTHDVIGTDRFEIVGDRGKIVIEDSKKATIKRLHKSEQEMNATMGMMDVMKLMMGGKTDALYSTEVIEEAPTWGTQHCEVMENFADAVLNDAPLLAPGTEGIRGVEMANAIHLSSWLGKPVSLPLDEELFLSELNKRIAAEGKYEPKN